VKECSQEGIAYNMAVSGSLGAMNLPDVLDGKVTPAESSAGVPLQRERLYEYLFKIFHHSIVVRSFY
jgi:hypothetical protein